MTVAELIEQLKQFPQDLPVYIYSEEDYPIEPQVGYEDIYMSYQSNEPIKAITLN